MYSGDYMKEIEKIELEKTNLFSKDSYAINNILKKFNIKTVKDFLDAYDIIVNKKFITNDNRNEIKGLTDLLKFKYLDIPIISDAYLDTILESHYYDDYIFIDWPKNSLSRMGFNNIECRTIDSFAKTHIKKNITIYNIFLAYIKYEYKKSNINSNNSVILEKILLLINSYKKRREDEIIFNNRKKELNLLKLELKNLLIRKNEINIKIEDVKKKIYMIEHKN